MSTYPIGKEIEYTNELERIAIKMDNGIDYDTAKSEFDYENREIILFEGM